jgi:hypothetical protein
MSTWTPEAVADRFREAADTARRLPPVRVQGYFNLWPPVVQSYPREASEHLPPLPAAIDRMEEAMRWVLWLSVGQRKLVWMRADDYDWRDICRRLGCDRTTAWRHWKKALAVVAEHLNGRPLKAARDAPDASHRKALAPGMSWNDVT